MDIIRKYNERLSYWISELDNGRADAFIQGIEQATGDYIPFIHLDYFLLNNKTLELTYDSIQDQVDYYIFQVMSI